MDDFDDIVEEAVTATDDLAAPVDFASDLTEAATATDGPVGPAIFLATSTAVATATDSHANTVVFDGTVHTEYVFAVDDHGGSGEFAGDIAAVASASDDGVVTYFGEILESLAAADGDAETATATADDEMCSFVIPAEDNPLLNPWKHVLGVDIKSTRSTRR